MKKIVEEESILINKYRLESKNITESIDFSQIFTFEEKCYNSIKETSSINYIKNIHSMIFSLYILAINSIDKSDSIYNMLLSNLIKKSKSICIENEIGLVNQAILVLLRNGKELAANDLNNRLKIAQLSGKVSFTDKVNCIGFRKEGIEILSIKGLTPDYAKAYINIILDTTNVEDGIKYLEEKKIELSELNIVSLYIFAFNTIKFLSETKMPNYIKLYNIYKSLSCKMISDFPSFMYSSIDLYDISILTMFAKELRLIGLLDMSLDILDLSYSKYTEFNLQYSSFLSDYYASLGYYYFEITEYDRSFECFKTAFGYSKKINVNSFYSDFEILMQIINISIILKDDNNVNENEIILKSLLSKDSSIRLDDKTMFNMKLIFNRLEKYEQSKKLEIRENTDISSKILLS